MLLNKRKKQAFLHFCFLSVFLLIFCYPVYSKTPYLDFDLPESWICKSFGPNWICSHKEEQRYALIIITAKMNPEKGTLNDILNKMNKNVVQAPKKVNINKHIWVESFHKNEFGDLLSRKEATICCPGFSYKFQVVVGFYAPKDLYPRYASTFLKAIRSFDLSKNEKLIKRALRKQSPQNLQNMDNYLQSLLYDESDIPSVQTPKTKTQTYFLISLLVIFFGFSGLVWFFYKRKRRERKRRRKRYSKRH